MPPPSPRPSWWRPPRWASGWCAPRAKIRQAGIPFRVPERAELAERLDAVLAAIYAAFAEGWSDPAGTEARRRNLAEEGIWLGRLVASLLPDEPEALGLLALMLHAEARRAARRNAQRRIRAARGAGPGRVGRRADRGGRGAAAAAPARWAAIGRYQLEAAVQSAHAARRLDRPRPTGRRSRSSTTRCSRSPARRWLRSIARSRIAETQGAAAGLAALDALADDTRLADYQPYWAARAGLLARMGDDAGGRPAPTSARSGSKAIRPSAAFCKRRAAGQRFDPEVGTGFRIRSCARRSMTSRSSASNDRAAHSLRSLGAEADLRRHRARNDGLPARARDREQRHGRLGRGVLGRLAGDAGRDRALGRAARRRAERDRRAAHRALRARAA